jgi:hypothetical protein
MQKILKLKLFNFAFVQFTNCIFKLKSKIVKLFILCEIENINASLKSFLVKHILSNWFDFGMLIATSEY